MNILLCVRLCAFMCKVLQVVKPETQLLNILWACGITSYMYRDAYICTNMFMYKGVREKPMRVFYRDHSIHIDLNPVK